MTLATIIGVGLGLHNLGEGLAIGAAYAVGAAALGTFLMVGFIIQNITEGLGIIVPISKDKPAIRSLALLGLIGGGPSIVVLGSAVWFTPSRYRYCSWRSAQEPSSRLPMKLAG